MTLFKGGLNFFRTKVFPRRQSFAKLGDKWQRTYDVYGHKAAFPIVCQFCKSKMMLRFTEVIPDRNRVHCISEGINCIAYKCPRCHVMYKFFVVDSREYLLDILNNKRDGVSIYLPPKKVWEKENKEIKQRLKDLGYM